VLSVPAPRTKYGDYGQQDRDAGDNDSDRRRAFRFATSAECGKYLTEHWDFPPCRISRDPHRPFMIAILTRTVRGQAPSR
jgi:hypothetical protein